MGDEFEFSRYMPYEIYNNILLMIEHRGVTINHTKLTENEVSRIMTQMSNIIIEGNKGDVICIYAYLPIGFAASTLTISNILYDIKSKYAKVENINNKEIELMFISENDLLKITHRTTYDIVVKILANFKLKKGEMPSASEVESARRRIYCEEYTYSPFSFNVLTNYSIPTHRIITEDEFQKEMAGMFRDKHDLKHILVNDTPVIWIGGKPGDIVQIDSYSNITGKRVEWRMCVPK